MTWDEIVAAADGGTVNWYMWGGDDAINAYVIEYLGGAVEERYNITLNQVRIVDTVDAVSQVLGETEAGVFADGSVDMIWINGENFRTMKQAGLLFCEYWDVLPNIQYISPTDETLLFDFGTAVDGCETPWGRAQVAMIYDSAFIETPPADMDALLQHIRDNPGTFTYPAPPDFTGSVFVRQVLYNEADKLFADEGGYKVLLGDFDEELYAQVAEATWETLNEIEPYLWREGSTYPTDKPALDQLYANSEVTMNMTYDPAGVGLEVESGLFSETTRTYGLESGTISNVHFVAIPYNSPNKAAALVLANFSLSPDAQFEKNRPDVWGDVTVLDVTTVSADLQTAWANLPRHPSVVAPEDLAPLAQPELRGDWLTRIEADWETYVASQ